MEPLLYEEIDLRAFIANIRTISRRAGNREVIPVIKSDAYGTGALPAARAIEKAGIRMAAVVDALEAEKILVSGFKKDLLVLNGLEPRLPGLLKYPNLVLSVNSLDDIMYLESVASDKVRVHIQVETGMNRLGTRTLSEAQDMITLLAGDRRFSLEGIFTHFTDPENASRQLELFKPYVALHPFPWVHCAVSTTYETVSYGNAVRGGIDMYGGEKKDGLTQILSVKARPLAIHDVAVGDTVGYSRTFTATEAGRIAVLPIGYADGYRRAFQGFHVLVKGHLAPVVGRVCMNHTFVWIPSDVTLSDEFTITSPLLPLHELAEAAGTISYEIQCGFAPIATKRYKE